VPGDIEVIEEGPDLSILNEDGLRMLVRNLMKRVKELERVVESGPADPTQLADLRKKNDRLLVRIEELNRENGDLRARLSLAVREQRTAIIAPDQEDVPRFSPGNAKYRYEYEYYLVSVSGSGRMVVRSSRTGKSVVRYNYEEYMDDRIGVDIFFRNDSDEPASYSMAIIVGGKVTGFLEKRREVLARATYRTPVILPGEVYQFSKTMMVDDPKEVQVVEVGSVKSAP